MEKVLSAYERDYDPKYPVVCFDERACVLHADVTPPMPIKPGRVQRQDYHYERKGTCAILMAVEPLRGRRIAQVRARKTKRDYSEFMKALTSQYRNAEKIILIQDNLNTHTPGSFYESFGAKEAFALAERFEIVYTPKRASWFNMVEVELAALVRQCLDRRIPDQTTLAQQLAQWVQSRNHCQVKINWQFTQSLAREKFHRFYQHVRN